jgi:DNA-binding response OmpR family regulator
MGHTILVVDDDRKTVELIKLYLERDRYRVLVAYDGHEALLMARQQRPDLLVLDVMLPTLDGLDVCSILRAETAVPIILLTARTTEEDTLIGLDRGADDYIAKPFSPREVVARVRTVLRRAGATQPSGPVEVRYGELHVHFRRHEARLGEQLLHLTPKEFKLLATLCSHPGEPFTRLQLLEDVFGPEYEGFERTVDVHVMNLRRKLERHGAPQYIQTVYGIGYKWVEERDAA